MLYESIIPAVGIGLLPISLRRLMTSLSKVDRNHTLSDHERKWLQTVRHLGKCGGSILHRHPVFIR